jgi:periplasmic divalent cation tolerance protein
MAGEILVFVTCPESESEKLARALVEEHLAACVNIIPAVRSIYLWDGKLCNESEHLLVIKTTDTVWFELNERVRALHSYDVPEIIAVPIEKGYQPYIEWLNSSIRAATGSDRR